MAALLRGELTALLGGRQPVVVDCRFPFEYSGGHIRGARNVYLQTDMRDRLFAEQPNTQLGAAGSSTDSGLVLVFYCEFSQERGPRMYATGYSLRLKDIIITVCSQAQCGAAAGPRAEQLPLVELP